MPLQTCRGTILMCLLPLHYLPLLFCYPKFTTIVHVWNFRDRECQRQWSRAIAPETWSQYIQWYLPSHWQATKEVQALSPRLAGFSAACSVGDGCR